MRALAPDAFAAPARRVGSADAVAATLMQMRGGNLLHAFISHACAGEHKMLNDKQQQQQQQLPAGRRRRSFAFEVPLCITKWYPVSAELDLLWNSGCLSQYYGKRRASLMRRRFRADQSTILSYSMFQICSPSATLPVAGFTEAEQVQRATIHI